MAEREFNLLDEPWIIAIHNDGSTEKVSIPEALARSGELRDLAGELPTQDVAVLRLLLAILHTVVSRYDEDGCEAPLTSPSMAVRRWKSIWKRGGFPMETIRAYLETYRDRFWLFDSDRPFYQAPNIARGTEYSAAKLNGELSESNNKVRLFPQRSGRGKSELAYDEAARWLLYVNGFDDTASKAVGKGLPSPGAGWLGKLGLTLAEGGSLFSTLMQNLVLLKDGGNELWGEEKPIWERETVKRAERTEVSMPDNPAELYTLQSRRLELRRQGDRVTGYVLLGGDFFNKENALNEPMTVWTNGSKNAKDPPRYLPKRHEPSRQLWRDFSAFLAGNGGKRPGVVNWLSRLMWEGALQSSLIQLRTVCAKYADKDFYLYDVVSDRMTFSAAMLGEAGERWVPMVIGEIEIAKLLVDRLAYLAACIAKATGSPDGGAERDAARETAYYRLDIPFRNWLRDIRVEEDMEEAADRWWRTAQGIAREIGRELIAAAGPQAMVGREYTEKNTKRYYCAPDAYNHFLYCTSGRQALMTGGKQNG